MHLRHYLEKTMQRLLVACRRDQRQRQGRQLLCMGPIVRSVSLCPDSTRCMTSGFFAINDGFVVCPSTKPISRWIRIVSCGSPPSTGIFEYGRFPGVVV